MQQELNDVKDFLLGYQEDLCNSFASLDGKEKFITDDWRRKEGGGGISRVLANGEVFEQGGVNFSHVFGDNLPKAATAHRPELAGRNFQALGVSIVMHPKNPFVPTSHFNVRFFCAEKDGEKPVWWFGGGFDLTPYYGFNDDCVYWHKIAKRSCDSVDETLYPKYKKWADDYFFLKHRQEARGIGGIFFDDFNELGFDKGFELIKNVGAGYKEAYSVVVNRRRDAHYGEKERNFQLYRRGRYVEFNLVYDRGTLFGLQSNGRTESILMSLPPIVNWSYNWHPEEGSKEAELYNKFLIPKDWANN